MYHDRSPARRLLAAVALTMIGVAASLPAHAAFDTTGSARVCGMAGDQSLDCQFDSDGVPATTTAAGGVSHSGSVDDWNAIPGGPFAGDASYAGSLASGALRVKAVANGHARSDAGVRLKDTVTFSGIASGGSTIRFEMFVTGTASWDPAPGVSTPGGTAEAQAALVATKGLAVLNSASANFRVNQPSIGRLVVLDVDVTRASPSFDLSSSLTASINVYQLNMGHPVGGGSMDLSHTAAVRVVLPAGVTMQSSSGVFLTQPIPEPGTYALLAAGLGCLGAVIRRGRRAPPRG